MHRLAFAAVIAALACRVESQSIGYGLPNFGLMYNPYTSPAWGYGLGPQYSTIRGAMASGLLYGGSAGGMAGYGMGGYGMGGLAGFGGGMMPYGPFASYAFPGLLTGSFARLGPYGRFPGSTGTVGYGSHAGYGVYNGFGSYPGVGALTSFGDFNHYLHREQQQPPAQQSLATVVSLPSHYEGDGHERVSQTETKEASESD